MNRMITCLGIFMMLVVTNQGLAQVQPLSAGTDNVDSSEFENRLSIVADSLDEEYGLTPKQIDAIIGQCDAENISMPIYNNGATDIPNIQTPVVDNEMVIEKFLSCLERNARLKKEGSD